MTTPTPPPIRIANCSGFYGDRTSAAHEMVEEGPIDVLTGDWLAELTLLILARSQNRPGGVGYARTFLTQMEQVLGTCMDRGIKVVANAGGLDPAGCATQVRALAQRLGIHPKVAHIEGDDLRSRIGPEGDLASSLLELSDDAPIDLPSLHILSANAYLGCWGIVEALRGGADVVITGRTTDAAIVCGPAAWHHGWAPDDWDALAGAVVAGHVIECGTQATGGNYSFFEEVPGLENVGFPWAEIASDGSAVIGKHTGTGGLASIETVTSQLLYEIGAPAYLGPDVIAHFDTIELDSPAPDRVRISGTVGSPPPSTLKVALNHLGGFRNDIEIGVTGLDVPRKVAALESAFWRAAPTPAESIDSVTTTLTRIDRPDPETNREATAIWSLTVRDSDQEKIGRSFANTAVEIALGTIPGFFLTGPAPAAARPYGVFRPARVPARLITQTVHHNDGRATPITPPPDLPPLPEQRPHRPNEESTGGPGTHPEPTRRMPLGRLIGARSGDKGGDANVGVFARNDATWAWLDDHLTVERLRELLPETAALDIERHRLPGIRSLNFVIRGLLQEGVAASTRFDPQAKSLGEWLRAREVDVPTRLLIPRDSP